MPCEGVQLEMRSRPPGPVLFIRTIQQELKDLSAP
jgi:hypothetical protein